MDKLIAITLLTFVLLLGSTRMTHAHTRYDIEGTEYAIVVGWVHEPPVVDVANQIYIEILDGENGFVGAEQTVDVQLQYAGKNYTMNLHESDKPGVYASDTFIPTVRGTLDVRIFGDLAGSAVELTAAPEEIASAGQLQFPERVPSAYDQSTKMADLEAAVQSARTIGMGGIVAGVIGIAVGVFGLRKR